MGQNTNPKRKWRIFWMEWKLKPNKFYGLKLKLSLTGNMFSNMCRCEKSPSLGKAGKNREKKSGERKKEYTY